MDITWWGIPAVALVVAVVQWLKALGINSRYAGVVAVVLGIAGGIASQVWSDSPLAQSIVTGLIVGLAAAGAWSTGKHLAGE